MSSNAIRPQDPPLEFLAAAAIKSPCPAPKKTGPTHLPPRMTSCVRASHVAVAARRSRGPRSKFTRVKHSTSFRFLELQADVNHSRMLRVSSESPEVNTAPGKEEPPFSRLLLKVRLFSLDEDGNSLNSCCPPEPTPRASRSMAVINGLVKSLASLQASLRSLGLCHQLATHWTLADSPERHLLCLTVQDSPRMSKDQVRDERGQAV